MKDEKQTEEEHIVIKGKGGELKPIKVQSETDLTNPVGETEEGEVVYNWYLAGY